jgi:membrane fusion protein, multidrug efflux system
MSASPETEQRSKAAPGAKPKKQALNGGAEREDDALVPAPVAPPPAAKGSRVLFWLIAIAVFGTAAYLTTTRIMDLRAATQAKAPPPRVIPVLTAVVERQNLDLHLTGLGTVTAYNTVTLRSRVEGELIKVAFSEGQFVEKDQLLVEIDPRPYQVQLDQAQGQLAKDEAALRNSQLDLARSSALVQSKTVTQQQVDSEEAMVHQNEGIVQSDQAMVDMAKLQLSYCRIIPMTFAAWP